MIVVLLRSALIVILLWPAWNINTLLPVSYTHLDVYKRQGHITYVELDGEAQKNVKAIAKIVKVMHLSLIHISIRQK